jgi:hypothetical protein
MLCAPLCSCRQLALHDAIMRHLSGPTLVQPTVIVALALGSLYASFVCFAQSVRLYVHTVSAAQHLQACSVVDAGCQHIKQLTQQHAFDWGCAWWSTSDQAGGSARSWSSWRRHALGRHCMLSSAAGKDHR